MNSVNNPNRGTEKQYFIIFDTYNIAESLREAAAIIDKIQREEGLTAVLFDIDNRVGSVSRNYFVITFKDKRWTIPAWT